MQRKTEMAKPTYQVYSELQEAYDVFNRALFGNVLPECILLLDNKEKRVCGYFRSNQFINDKADSCDAIALNPLHFESKKVIGVMQTIVHEMCHLWQHHFGQHKPVRAYHNKEWADKMQSIGLMPSVTGIPGGKRTGQNMDDYLIEGGLLEKVCNDFLTSEYKISWREEFRFTEACLDIPTSETKLTVNKSLRKKYTCTKCKINLWGKPGLNIICGECGTTFSEEE